MLTQCNSSVRSERTKVIKGINRSWELNMSRIIVATTTGLVFLSAIVAGTLYATQYATQYETQYANSDLETLNAQVDSEAKQMTTGSGNTLSEKQKEEMLVGKILTADEKALKYQEKAAMVIATYQLSDPREQHKLLSATAHKDSKI
jgi:hypothetical protein